MKWWKTTRQQDFSNAVTEEKRAFRSFFSAMSLPVQRKEITKFLQKNKRLFFSASIAIFIAFVIWILMTPVPTFESARSTAFSSEATLLDRHGLEIQRLRLDNKRRMLDWVPLSNVSTTFQSAILAAEDKRFYWHPGIDPIGAVSALFDNFQRAHGRGASTITMQLANILAESGGYGMQHGWMSKLRQIRYALAIELHWSKREILEAYLNLVSFRGELVGIDAASRGLLAKGPAGLDYADAAVLASLVRAPNASRIAIARRACTTLKAVNIETSLADGKRNIANLCERTAFIAASLPQYPYPMQGADEAPHLARRILKKPGEKVTVTLDASLQRFAHDTLRTHLAELRNQNVEDGAVVVLDNASGEVLAYVGSSGDLSGAPEVDGVVALRQPGSTLKPFLYGLAIDQGWLNASSVLDDSPLALTTPSGLYIPQDYDRNFHGAVSVRYALGSSLNVPAVRALTMVGVDHFLNTLRELGLSNLTQEADHYGFGLALGGAETTLLQLTNAYRTLANNGQWSPTSFNLVKENASIPKANAELQQVKQVLSAQASFVIADILADPTARSLTFGLSSPLSTNTWAAVKTGTSKAMRDNWAVGFTDRYTIGVWVGNFSGAPMWDVSGVTGAAPVWRDIVEYLHQSTPSVKPLPPQGVVHQQVTYRPAIESSRGDWIVKRSDSEHKSIVLDIKRALPMLVAPPDSAIIAPDPDIPERRQALLLQSNGVTNTCLKLDSHPVGKCGVAKVLIPLPLPGRHELTLSDSQGNVVDTHHFEVRALNISKFP